MNLQIENEKRQPFRGGFAGLIHHFQLTPYPINRKLLQKSRLTMLDQQEKVNGKLPQISFFQSRACYLAHLYAGKGCAA